MGRRQLKCGWDIILLSAARIGCVSIVQYGFEMWKRAIAHWLRGIFRVQGEIARAVFLAVFFNCGVSCRCSENGSNIHTEFHLSFIAYSSVNRLHFVRQHDFLPAKTAPSDVVPMVFGQPIDGRIRSVPSMKIAAVRDGDSSKSENDPSSFLRTYTCPPPFGTLQCVTTALHASTSVSKANREWDTAIRLVTNDCWRYVDSLVKSLCVQ
mmetsp:Transcript_21883/g.35222  ORF Transcript_21883/g.35222 Transcript_21883/m.35222 type:complete len:209 (+) Transcript_21883:249-875(+)